MTTINSSDMGMSGHFGLNSQMISSKNDDR